MVIGKLQRAETDSHKPTVRAAVAMMTIKLIIATSPDNPFRDTTRGQTRTIASEEGTILPFRADNPPAELPMRLEKPSFALVTADGVAVKCP
jgi:hypothetical protein